MASGKNLKIRIKNVDPSLMLVVSMHGSASELLQKKPILEHIFGDQHQKHSVDAGNGVI